MADFSRNSTVLSALALSSFSLPGCSENDAATPLTATAAASTAAMTPAEAPAVKAPTATISAPEPQSPFALPGSNLNALSVPPKNTVAAATTTTPVPAVSPVSVPAAAAVAPTTVAAPIALAHHSALALPGMVFKVYPTVVTSATPAPAAKTVDVALDNLEQLKAFFEKETEFSVVGTGPSFKPDRPLCIMVADVGSEKDDLRAQYVENIAIAAEKLNARGVVLNEYPNHQEAHREMFTALKKIFGASLNYPEVPSVGEALAKRLPNYNIVFRGPTGDMAMDLAVFDVVKSGVERMLDLANTQGKVQLTQGNKGTQNVAVDQGVKYLARKYRGFPTVEIAKFATGEFGADGVKSYWANANGVKTYAAAMMPAFDWERENRVFKGSDYFANEIATGLANAKTDRSVILLYNADHVSVQPLAAKVPMPDRTVQAQLDKRGINCIVVGLRKEKLDELRKIMGN